MSPLGKVGDQGTPARRLDARWPDEMPADVRTIEQITVEERLVVGRAEIAELAGRWAEALGRLERAAAWFAGRRFRDDPERWERNEAKRRELERICVGAFLRLSWQVKDYAEACREATPAQLERERRAWGRDPRDGRALWIAALPSPDECARLVRDTEPDHWWPAWLRPLPAEEEQCASQ